MFYTTALFDRLLGALCALIALESKAASRHQLVPLTNTTLALLTTQASRTTCSVSPMPLRRA
eukprot:scaffold186692_cov43-Tisochrysis_lutea.AAC.3